MQTLKHLFLGERMIRLKLEPLDEGGHVATSPGIVVEAQRACKATAMNGDAFWHAAFPG